MSQLYDSRMKQRAAVSVAHDSKNADVPNAQRKQQADNGKASDDGCAQTDDSAARQSAEAQQEVLDLIELVKQRPEMGEQRRHGWSIAVSVRTQQSGMGAGNVVRTLRVIAPDGIRLNSKAKVMQHMKIDPGMEEGRVGKDHAAGKAKGARTGASSKGAAMARVLRKPDSEEAALLAAIKRGMQASPPPGSAYSTMIDGPGGAVWMLELHVFRVRDPSKKTKPNKQLKVRTTLRSQMPNIPVPPAQVHCRVAFDCSPLRLLTQVTDPSGGVHKSLVSVERLLGLKSEASPADSLGSSLANRPKRKRAWYEGSSGDELSDYDAIDSDDERDGFIEELDDDDSDDQEKGVASEDEDCVFTTSYVAGSCAGTGGGYDDDDADTDDDEPARAQALVDGDEETLVLSHDWTAHQRFGRVSSFPQPEEKPHDCDLYIEDIDE